MTVSEKGPVILEVRTPVILLFTHLSKYSVGVLKYHLDGPHYRIYPQEDILGHCQTLFGATNISFEPSQVFIVLKSKMGNGNFSQETEFLLRAMQTRLCISGVRDTREGQLIQLALAFQRIISVRGIKLPPFINNSGFITDIQSILPGIWEIKIRFSTPTQEHVELVRGNIATILQVVFYCVPPTPTGTSGKA